MKNLNESSNNKKLKPILIFGEHIDPALILMIKNSFNHLSKMGYKALLWEYKPDVSLDDLIHLMSQNLNTINVLLTWLGTFGLTEEYLLKANNHQRLCALENTPLHESDKILVCKSISEITHDRALFSLLLLCKQHGMGYYGIDWAGTNRSLNISFEESCIQDPIRESYFAKNISQYVNQYQGGIICIMGALHYPVQKLLKLDPALGSYSIKSFLKAEPNSMLLQIKRINGYEVNHQSDAFELGVFDYSNLEIQQEIDQAFLNDLDSIEKTKVYLPTVHHFFQKHNNVDENFEETNKQSRRFGCQIC